MKPAKSVRINPTQGSGFSQVPRHVSSFLCISCIRTISLKCYAEVPQAKNIVSTNYREKNLI